MTEGGREREGERGIRRSAEMRDAQTKKWFTMKRSSSAMKRVRDREKADPTPRPRPPPVPRRQSYICEGDGYEPIFEDQYSQTLLLPRENVRQRAVVIVPGNNLSERGADLQWEGRTRTRRRAPLPANNLLNAKFFSRPKK